MISAIILAAGQSKRMGQPKMLLPWGRSTVLEHVIATFLEAGLEEILVVTGGAREQVEHQISRYPIRKIHNEEFASGEMLSSIQCALRAITDRTDAVLVGLGDQPQVQGQVVKQVCEAYRQSGNRLIVPSFDFRRGHPWLVARPLCRELLEMKSPDSPRNFLTRHASEIHYVNVETDSILADLDTAEDYQRFRPEA